MDGLPRARAWGRSDRRGCKRRLGLNAHARGGAFKRSNRGPERLARESFDARSPSEGLEDERAAAGTPDEVALGGRGSGGEGERGRPSSVALLFRGGAPPPIASGQY